MLLPEPMRPIRYAACLLGFVIAPAAADQVPVGEPFLIAQFEQGQLRLLDAASEGDGTFVVVWSTTATADNDSVVQGRRLTDRGAALTDVFAISEDTTGSRWTLEVATDAAGNFVVAWASSQTGEHAVFARRFEADATPLGGEFQVNTATIANLAGPTVSSNAAGDVVVAWGGFSDGVLATVFDSAGSTTVPEFLVNDPTTPPGASFLDVSAGIASDRSFTVGWGSQFLGESGTDSQLFQRRFSDTGVPLGPAVQISDAGDDGNFASALDSDIDRHDEFLVVWHEQLNLAFGAVMGRKTDTSGTLGPAKVLHPVSEGHSFSMADTGEFVVVSQSYYANPPYSGAVFDREGDPIRTFTLPAERLGTIVVTRTRPSTYVRLTTDDEDNLIGQLFVDRFFADGFESGDTGQWPVVVP